MDNILEMLGLEFDPSNPMGMLTGFIDNLDKVKQLTPSMENVVNVQCKLQGDEHAISAVAGFEAQKDEETGRTTIVPMIRIVAWEKATIHAGTEKEKTVMAISRQVENADGKPMLFNLFEVIEMLSGFAQGIEEDQKLDIVKNDMQIAPKLTENGEE